MWKYKTDLSCKSYLYYSVQQTNNYIHSGFKVDDTPNGR